MVPNSQSLLIMYTNNIKQSPGFETELFEWIYEEIMRQNILPEGMVGGIIFYEMSIQQDFLITKNGDVVELTRFVGNWHRGRYV